MRRRRKKGLIGKWRLAIGVVLTLWGVGNLFFNKEWTDARHFCHLQEDPYSLRSLFTRKANAKSVEESALALSTAELQSFADAFMKRDIVISKLPPEPTRGNGATPPVAPKENPIKKGLWAPRVVGTFTDVTDDKPTALIGGRYIKVDGKIFSKKDETRCGYQILSIGKRCVWMVAYDRARGDVPELPAFQGWPDVSFIEHEKRAGELVPVNVRLASGKKFKLDEGFRIGAGSDIVYKIAKLWQQGACFEIGKVAGGDGGGGLYLVCILVVGR